MSQMISSGKRSAGLFNNENRRKITWVLFLLPALIIYLTFMAVPLFDSLRLSLYTGEGYNPTKFVGFQNYIDLFTNPLWRERFFGAVLHLDHLDGNMTMKLYIPAIIDFRHAAASQQAFDLEVA